MTSDSSQQVGEIFREYGGFCTECFTRADRFNAKCKQHFNRLFRNNLKEYSKTTKKSLFHSSHRLERQQQSYNNRRDLLVGKSWLSWLTFEIKQPSILNSISGICMFTFRISCTLKASHRVKTTITREATSRILVLYRYRLLIMTKVTYIWSFWVWKLYLFSS